MVVSRDFSNFFPNPRTWKSGLVAKGGDFSLDRMLYAYTHGIFPWTENPIRWFCLDPRAIFDIERVHFSRTVLRKVKQQKFRIGYNLDFVEVMRGCAQREEGTWITEGFFAGYTELHRQGYAHSFEARDELGNLVGGVYGLAIGKFFAGESMFATASDAGKVALYYLFEALKNSGFQLFDTQELNHVTWNLGAYEIPKTKYLDRLEKAVADPSPWVISPQFLEAHSIQHSTLKPISPKPL